MKLMKKTRNQEKTKIKLQPKNLNLHTLVNQICH